MFGEVNRFFRIISSAISFTLFGIGGLLLSYLWFPLIRIVYQDKSQRELACQTSISRCFRFFTEMMRALRILDLNISNLNRLQNSQACIVVANHPTLIDVVILIGYMRQCDCIVKAELWKNPFMRHVVSMAGYIPNQSESLIEECQNKLAQGRKLLVFPEGTRTLPGQPVQCKRGAAQLAVRCQAQVQPVTIGCHPLALYKGSRWYQMPKSPMQFDINVGLPQETTELLRTSPAPSTAARKLTRYFDVALQPTISKNIEIKEFFCAKPRTTS
ncbi:lysophospholipid acyltransferase family protein [Paraferrimonas sedimenticola]|nr:lysophospholipid acyltransferase family protein [Paraferrimonas sedimenticola]